jgi:hypothetical protein
MRNKNKCPKCGCKETKYTGFSVMGGVEAEYKVVCKNCGNIKDQFEYGLLVIEDWKDPSRPPFLRRIRDYFYWKRINRLTRKGKLKDKEIDLPF